MLSAEEIQRQRARSLTISDSSAIRAHGLPPQRLAVAAASIATAWRSCAIRSPGLDRSNRLVEFIPSAVVFGMRLSSRAGMSFIDSTASAAGNSLGMRLHTAVAGLAHCRATAVGWLAGVTASLMVSDRGEALHRALMPGATDGRKPVPAMARTRFENRVGDAGFSFHNPARCGAARMHGGIGNRRLVSYEQRRMPEMNTRALRNHATAATISDRRRPIARRAHARH